MHGTLAFEPVCMYISSILTLATKQHRTGTLYGLLCEIMKIIPALAYGEAESLMTDTVNNIHRCLAAWHSGVRRLRFAPAPSRRKPGLVCLPERFLPPLLLWKSSRPTEG